jgi:hypothetical protein
MLNGRYRSVSTHWPAALPGQRRVLLHVGLHKTGSTALQRFLSNAAEELRVQGVLYPTSGRPPTNPEGHHNIAWQLGGDRRFRSFAGTLDDVASEISSFPGDAILSSEDFESILGTPIRFVPLLEHPLLKAHAFTIVFWVRDQASYLESLFFEMLHHRMAEEGARFCEAALAYGQVRHEDWTFHTDYDSIRTGLLGLRAKIAVRPYARVIGGSTVIDCLTYAGLGCNAAESEERANSRGSLAEALSLFCQHRLGKALADRVAPYEALLPLLDGRSAHLSSSFRAALIARFAAGNKRLAKSCGFPAESLTILPLPPADSIPLEAVFSLRTQSVFADFAGDDVNTTEPRSILSTAVDNLLHTVWC